MLIFYCEKAWQTCPVHFLYPATHIYCSWLAWRKILVHLSYDELNPYREYSVFLYHIASNCWGICYKYWIKGHPSFPAMYHRRGKPLRQPARYSSLRTKKFNKKINEKSHLPPRPCWRSASRWNLLSGPQTPPFSCLRFLISAWTRFGLWLKENISAC